MKGRTLQLFGDGAGALNVGNSEVIASIEGSYSVYSEVLDTWRLEGNPFVQSWEERFILGEGYVNGMEKVIWTVLDVGIILQMILLLA